jgi:transcriptional regulator
MYSPPHFRENDPAVLRSLIEERPFATLVTHSSAGISASHLPMLVAPAEEDDGADRLLGHLAAPNPQARLLLEAGEGIEALAVFQGPHAYVSPSWYPSKREHGKVVPTWNYVAVHAYGRVTAFNDSHRLRDLVGMLTDREEGKFEAPWAVDDAPPDFTEKMLKGIVGVEMEVARLEGSWKLSQNKSEDDRRGVIDGLRRGRTADGEAVARLMSRRQD